MNTFFKKTFLSLSLVLAIILIFCSCTIKEKPVSPSQSETSTTQPTVKPIMPTDSSSFSLSSVRDLNGFKDTFGKENIKIVEKANCTEYRTDGTFYNLTGEYVYTDTVKKNFPVQFVCDFPIQHHLSPTDHSLYETEEDAEYNKNVIEKIIQTNKEFVENSDLIGTTVYVYSTDTVLDTKNTYTEDELRQYIKDVILTKNNEVTRVEFLHTCKGYNISFMVHYSRMYTITFTASLH